MSEAVQQIEKTRITGITIDRLHNLGNYEHVKYSVRVEIAPGDDPGKILTSLEAILDDLRAESGVSSYELRRAHETIGKPESELSDFEKRMLPDYWEYVKKHDDAMARRERARAALLKLNYTKEHVDHKEKWEDDDGDDGLDF
jgi:hypothetical protein